MDGCELDHSFQLDDHQIVNEEIKTIAHIDHDAIVVNCLRFLPLHREAPLGQFMLEACFISAFQQAWTELLMDLESSIHNL